MEPLSTHNRGWHVQLLFLFLQVLVSHIEPSLIAKSYGRAHSCLLQSVNGLYNHVRIQLSLPQSVNSFYNHAYNYNHKIYHHNYEHPGVINTKFVKNRFWQQVCEIICWPKFLQSWF